MLFFRFLKIEKKIHLIKTKNRRKPAKHQSKIPFAILIIAIPLEAYRSKQENGIEKEN
jgi:hypothetical protein